MHYLSLNSYAANFFRLIFIHLKLELLTQFPASHEEKKYIYAKIDVFKM